MTCKRVHTGRWQCRFCPLLNDTAGCPFVKIFATPGWRIPSIWDSRQYEGYHSLSSGSITTEECRHQRVRFPRHQGVRQDTPFRDFQTFLLEYHCRKCVAVRLGSPRPRRWLVLRNHGSRSCKSHFRLRSCPLLLGRSRIRDTARPSPVSTPRSRFLHHRPTDSSGRYSLCHACGSTGD